MIMTGGEPEGRRVEPKPGSDYPDIPPANDWDRDRRVKLPNDRLIGRFAITLLEFRRLTA